MITQNIFIYILLSPETAINMPAWKANRINEIRANQPAHSQLDSLNGTKRKQQIPTF